MAVEQKVDFLITVCADQVLEVAAKVAEELGMPWYIDNTTATNVSKKSYMKKIFVENDIPTSKHIILDKFDEDAIADLSFPIIVKPVDSYGSRGVRRVEGFEELLAEGVITEYNILKAPGYKFGLIKSSGDRVAFYTIETDCYEKAAEKSLIASERIKVKP